MAGLKYLKFDFTIRGGEAPLFTGSALRGAFGHSLKKVCCINPKGICEECFAESTCLYYDFFENKNRGHGYRFGVAIPSSGWNFSFYLFGDSCDRAPYALSALNMALREGGVGAKRERVQIVSVWCGEKLVFGGDRYELKGVKPNLFEPKSDRKISKIVLKTPLRLKSDGKRVAPDEITALALALSALRRLDEIEGREFQKRRFEYEREKEAKRLEFVDLARYSNRQKTKMALGGYVGEIECAPVGEELSAALQLGEIIGVGKSVVFGLGEIKLEEEK